MNTTPATYNLYMPAGDNREVGRLSAPAHVTRVKAALLRAAQESLDDHGFTQVLAPVLTTLSGACGEPGTLIPVNVHGRRAYLRQTSQLHLEPLMRELGRVYSVGRSFRAERRADDRHLTEFTLLEGEAAGWDLEQVMALMERIVLDMLRRAATKERDSLVSLSADPARLERVRTPFARMTYDEAIIALQRNGHFIEWGEDLANSHELALTQVAGGPLFVTHYPAELRFFTMKASRRDPRIVECCDLLLPGVGEVMGASETEPDPAVLERKMASSRGVKQILDLGGSVEDYGWYVDMHRFSSGQQAGFGMGFERLVRYVCGLRSVNEAVV